MIFKKKARDRIIADVRILGSVHGGRWGPMTDLGDRGLLGFWKPSHSWPAWHFLRVHCTVVYLNHTYIFCVL